MITKYLPLCFDIYPYRHIQDRDRLRSVTREILQSQDQVVRSITRLASNLTISLRYFYDPNQSPQLKTYLLINQSPDSQTEEISEQIFSLLTKGKLSEFFTLKPQTDLSQFQRLEWVQFIGEILKHEEFIEPQNYYLPHFFEANPANDMSAVCDVSAKLDSRLMLEITLQTYQNPYEKPFWVNAINQMLSQLDKVNASASGAKDTLLSATLALYQKYQQLYPNGDLFNYSIKALAENRGDVFAVLNTLIEHSTKETPHGKQCRIVTVSQSQPGFSESLQATEKVEISTAIEWQGWQKDFGQKLIKEAIKPKKSGWGKLADGSLDITARPSLPSGANSAPNQNQPKDYDAVLGGSPLAKFSSSPPPSRIVDLKPLHRLANAQEISGFFRIAIPRVTYAVSSEEPANRFPEKLTIEDVVRLHKNLIAEDSYVVGIDQNGKPHVSYWSKIPHRIVAGTTGSGKTNFLQSIIYQFLYANSDRELYIADFQAGLHYKLIAKKHNLKMVTEGETFADLLDRLWKEHCDRRDLMLNYEVRSLDKLKDKYGIQKHRIVVIIDEAASLLSIDDRKIKGRIETHLKELAAKSRVTGIHIIYCSQRPTPDVIPRIISDNMEERVIFRVLAGASQLLLDNDAAVDLPVEPKGRAIYKGLEPGLITVATPYVPDEIWDSPLR